MIKKIYKIFISLYFVLLFVVIISSLNFFNQIRFFTNVSSSMTPEIQKGAVVVVKKQINYEKGDIISYYGERVNNVDIITHRIIDIGGNVYTTKGDANQLADRELVRPRLVIGKVILTIPNIGYMIMFSKTYLGNLLLIIFPAFLIILIEIVKIFKIIANSQKK